MEQAACEKCAFWARAKYPKQTGDCRRYAPSSFKEDDLGSDRPMFTRIWPQTFFDDWCGDYETETEKTADVILPSTVYGLKTFGFTTRAAKTVIRSQLKSLSEIASLTEDEFGSKTRFIGLGPQTRENIRAILAKYGFSFKT